VLGDDRPTGVKALAALAVVVGAARASFIGIRGGPVEKVAWVTDSRIPGMQGGSFTPLFSSEGAIVLFCDYFPFLVATIGLFIALLDRRSRGLAAAVVICFTTMLICFVVETHVVINGFPSEAVRFFPAPCFAALVLGLLWLPRIRTGSVARFAVLGALVVPPVFTVFWIRERKEIELWPWKVRGSFESTWHGAYGSNCRTIADARVGQRPELTYVDTAAWYRFAACRPIFAPGMYKIPWNVKIAPRGQWYPTTQIEDIQLMAGPNATIPAACSTDARISDPVCTYAMAHASCAAEGTDFVRCELTPRILAELDQRQVQHDAGWAAIQVPPEQAPPRRE
jgi:hypothetical protein